VRCGKRKHSFWEIPVVDMLTYVCKSRPWTTKIVAIDKNAKVLLKWEPELIVNGLKIMCMKMEHMIFLDSVYFLLCSLRNLPEAFGLTVTRSWYPTISIPKNT